MEKSIELVSKFYESLNQNDIETVLSLLHEDFEVTQSELLPWGGKFKGEAGFVKFSRLMLDAISPQAEAQEFIQAGENVIVLGRSRGRVNSNAALFDVRIVHIWAVADDKLLRFDVYIDTPAMKEALTD